MKMVMIRGVPQAKTDRSPSMQDIARAARVSLATVSLALNNHPRVAERTKQRVRKTASRLGFVPNHAARRLIRARFAKATNPFDQVGFVFFDRHGSELDGVYLSMLRGAEHQLSTMGAAMTFVRMVTEADRDKVIRLVKAGWVDGWLLTGEVNEEALRLFQSANSPCVVLGGHQCSTPVHSVDIDFNAVGQLAAEHLAQLGHRRVGFIGGSMRYEYQTQMLDAFRSTGRELGLDTDDRLIETSAGEGIRPVNEKLRCLLALRPLPTAIVTAELNYATTVLELLRQYELSVPGDISLLGCQLDGAPGMIPNITRIEQSFSQVGRTASSVLQEVAEKRQTPPRRILVSPAVVNGWSCGRVGLKMGTSSNQGGEQS